LNIKHGGKPTSTGKKLLLALLVVSIILPAPAVDAEENDLWLLISSYEDIGITVQDLSFFLATHGY